MIMLSADPDASPHRTWSWSNMMAIPNTTMNGKANRTAKKRINTNPARISLIFLLPWYLLKIMGAHQGRMTSILIYRVNNPLMIVYWESGTMHMGKSPIFSNPNLVVIYGFEGAIAWKTSCYSWYMGWNPHHFKSGRPIWQMNIGKGLKTHWYSRFFAANSFCTWW